jgi:sugar phosphate isomerase/epimerase
VIRFGIRQSFDSIDQIEDRYAGVSVPVEVALPYHWDIYEPVRPHLATIAEQIRSYGVEVLSVHAVQAPINNERFRTWGMEIAGFAKALGARTITLHPNNVNKDIGEQQKVLGNLEYFDYVYGTEIVFSIETFEGKRRVFNPGEIVRFNLPMTLDTSHIRSNEEIWDLPKGYRDRICNVHLSAREGPRQHLPIDGFCKEIVRYLIDHKWSGNVILEYLFEFHDRMREDLESLMAMQ